MKTIRRLAIAALVIAYAQVVFGAIVRITGSGLGCGDHWPRCMGHWLPPLDQPALIIEVTHRYLAVTLGVVMLALLIAAWRRRGEAGIADRGGPLRSAALATLLVGIVGGLGRVIVQHALDPRVIVVHLALAMSVLATLATTVMRAGGLGAAALSDANAPVSARTRRSSAVAAGLIAITVVFGALTANLPGAAGSCLGFPLCRGDAPAGLAGMRSVQLVHRAFALLAILHLTGVVIGTGRRRDALVVRRAGRIALGVGVAQILIAAALVEMRLPQNLQSLHQATGTLLWLSAYVFAALAARVRPVVPDAGIDPVARRSDIETPSPSAPPDSAPDGPKEHVPAEPSPMRDPGGRPETDQPPGDVEGHPDSPVDAPSSDEPPGIGTVDAQAAEVTRPASAPRRRPPTMAVIIARGADF